MLPRFEIVHRARPVAVVAEERRTGFVAPFAAVEAELGTHDVAGRLACELVAPGGVHLTGWYDGGRRLAGLDVTDASGRTTHHRSRRHGQPDTPPDALAAALTGSWLSVLTRSDGAWTVRGRVRLPPRVDPRRPELLAGLTAHVTWSPREPHGATPVTSWRSGTFGQLGLRDVHLVTHADGTPVEVDGLLYLSMTHAGPGFADTAHCGVWSYDPATHDLRPTARIYFRRGGLVLGDHATHLVRDGDRWLVATSTWGDFDRTSVAITLAESTDDLLGGKHVLDARDLPLPTDGLPGRRVGTWDPHLALIEGHWHVAFVTARKFFSFHPALARAAQPARLDGFELVAAATDRTATEGTVLTRIGADWRLRERRRRQPHAAPQGIPGFRPVPAQGGRARRAVPEQHPVAHPGRAPGRLAAADVRRDGVRRGAAGVRHPRRRDRHANRCRRTGVQQRSTPGRRTRMNRTSAAALAAAAVVGIAGGTYAASLGIDPGKDDGQRAGEQESSDTPGPSTPTRSEETPPPSSPAQLLYMDSEKIHDGYTHVAISEIGIKSVGSVVRISGGWLVVTGTSPQEAEFRGTIVAANGDQTDLGAFDGHWDINEDGTLFVAHRDDGYRVTSLTDTPADDVDLSGPAGATATANAAFAENAVLTGWTSATGDTTTLRTDLATGKRKVIRTGELAGWTASPRGLLMTGEVPDGASSCLEGGRVLGDHGDWWRTCDWRGYGLRPQYSPDGEQLLVVPSDTDGFGPGLYGVLDSETGRIRQEIEPPELTVSAEWGDNDEVFVLVQKDGEGAGQAIYRCKVGDECTKERESGSLLVLGAGV